MFDLIWFGLVFEFDCEFRVLICSVRIEIEFDGEGSFKWGS